MTFEIGDRVHWCDDPSQCGTVIKISAVPRRDGLGEIQDELPCMVLVQWDWSQYGGASGRKRWNASELLRKDRSMFERLTDVVISTAIENTSDHE